MKLKVFVSFVTEHLIEGRPLKHFCVVNKLLVDPLTSIAIFICSFDFGEAVALDNAIVFKGVI